MGLGKQRRVKDDWKRGQGWKGVDRYGWSEGPAMNVQLQLILLFSQQELRTSDMNFRLLRSTIPASYFLICCADPLCIFSSWVGIELSSWKSTFVSHLTKDTNK